MSTSVAEPLPLPTSLSPSKVSSFTDCALAFRFSAIDRLPEPPSVAATRGSLVHAALERLFLLPPAERTPEAASRCLDQAAAAFRADDEEFNGLGLDAEAEAVFLGEAQVLLDKYFRLEDPTTITPIGLELMLTADIDGLHLRGIIDRLELDEQGQLVVTDYKTGRAPSEAMEQKRLGGVAFYSLLCERVLGQRPARVQLLYLANPVALISTPTEQSTAGLTRRLKAVWSAVERACDRADFRPNPSKLCDWCGFKEFCPAFGGEIAKADALRVRRDAPGHLELA